ncbi:MAG: DUF6144 family protein [Promethearchaeota archaeon]|jgi:hypothetical protein
MQNKYQGWIEDFGNVVGEQFGVGTKEKVLDQCISCQKISNDNDMAQCIKEVMIQFDQVVTDKEKRDSVMEKLGNTCFHNFFSKIAEDVKKKSNGIEEIIQNINIASGGEHFKLIENKIYATFNQCLCQVGVKETVEPISKTYCSCSLGWMKSLFNLLLETNFTVELLESVVSGGNSCRFLINLG